MTHAVQNIKFSLQFGLTTLAIRHSAEYLYSYIQIYSVVISATSSIWLLDSLKHAHDCWQ